MAIVLVSLLALLVVAFLSARVAKLEALVVTLRAELIARTHKPDYEVEQNARDADYDFAVFVHDQYYKSLQDAYYVEAKPFEWPKFEPPKDYPPH